MRVVIKRHIKGIMIKIIVLFFLVISENMFSQVVNTWKISSGKIPETVKYFEKCLGVSVATPDNIRRKNGDWNSEISITKNIVVIPDYLYSLQCVGVIRETKNTDNLDMDIMFNKDDLDHNNDEILGTDEDFADYSWQTAIIPDRTQENHHYFSSNSSHIIRDAVSNNVNRNFSDRIQNKTL